MEFEPYFFRPQGVIKFKLDENELLPVKNEIQKILTDESSAEERNYTLAGHLQKQYGLNDCKEHLEKIVLLMTDMYRNHFGHSNHIDMIVAQGKKFYLHTCWVNFQQKTEFNPTHDHGGDYTFVIWVKNPYNKDEQKVFSKTSYEQLRNGCFEFIYTGFDGSIQKEKFFTDETFEGTGMLFPSVLNHTVWPYYTGEGYRISISGNVRLKL